VTPAGSRVVAAYHLVNAEEGIVHDYREVVGGNAVVASQYDIVNRCGDIAMQHVVHCVHGAVGPQPQCGLPAPAAIDPLGRCQIAARAGIARDAPVWRRRGLGDLPPAAEAFVRPIGQSHQRLLVRGLPL
jgi:hypothetical protein